MQRLQQFTLKVVVLFILLLLPITAHSKVVYVKYYGSDANSGLSWDLAKKTVTAGLAAAVAGDEVWVTKGTYLEMITLKVNVALYGGFIGFETGRSQRNWKGNITILDGNKGGTVVTSPDGATSATRIDGFTIQNGKTSTGGSGIHCSGSPTIINNIIAGNIADGTSGTCEGGGIYCGSSSSPIIANNIIAGNNADASNGASRGGGIYCSGSSVMIANNTITGNSAGDGGGICCSGSSTITNNVIKANSSSYFGAGIYCIDGSSTITNNTITGNVSDIGSGAIYCYDASPAISNNIVAFNSSGISNHSGTPTLHNNCVYNPDGYNYSELSAGVGDISADPLFASVEYGNFHIRPGSPCIGAGWNDAPRLPLLDMDSQARIQGGTVDIGADESDGSDPPNITIRVSPTGYDSNNGSSWTSAKRTVQAAINDVLVKGGEVWVKAGTYYERIYLYPYIHMYGGFGGNETTRSERNWNVNKSIIDGQAAGTVVTATAYGFKCSTSVDGFTIRNGRASVGGGIYCKNSSLTISNNTVTGNKASYNAGIYCIKSSPIITSNTIKANNTGILCTSNCSPIISNNTVSENSEMGIRCDSDCSAIIANNTISGNYWGIRCFDSFSSPTITSNTIAGNTEGITCDSRSSPIITNNTITRSNDGVRCYSYSTPTIFNNIVAFNSSGISNHSGTPTLHNNCVYNPDGYNYSELSAGVGDISADPLFASVEYGNFHIRPGSPCIGAGRNDAPRLPSVDMDSQARIQGGTVDIGADESDGSNPPAGPYIIVRVSPTGNDSNDGSSWQSAKCTVQAAIDAASALGGEVWVKAGTYNERISLRTFAYLYGGFGGTETARSERNWNLNKSIIDGGGIGSVVTASSHGYKSNSVDGFTICNGQYNIDCYASSPIITNNTISGGEYGVQCRDSSNPVISDNTISDNRYRGIYCNGSHPAITRNTITRNSGEGIHCNALSGAIITNNIITGNTNSSGSGSGICCYTYSPIIITNNTITGNGTSGGQGIECNNSSPTISNNIVAFNYTGIFKTGSYTPTLRNNCVYGNTSYNYSGLSVGTGDISADPAFINRSGGDYHLSDDSPCINTGWNDAAGLPGVDMDLQSRIWGGVVDMGADELWPDISQAKRLALNLPVDIKGAIVTAAFPDFFYIESDDRSSGIRVDKAAHAIQAGLRADVYGTLQVNADGECYIAATSASTNGAGSLAPLGLDLSRLGGGTFGYQAGVWGWQIIKDANGKHIRQWMPVTGLNTVGLLVKTWGRVKSVDQDYFIIDDGSNTNVKCLLLSPIQAPAQGSLVCVTGISSCEKANTETLRTIRARTADDVSVVHSP